MSAEEITAPYGTWTSKLRGEDLVKGAVQYQQIIVDQDELYWLESRPNEKGRIVALQYQGSRDLYDSPYNARTTVHEYGGKSAEMIKGCLYFSNFSDQQVYKVSKDKEPVRVTNSKHLRFADFSAAPNGRELFCVIEDHSNKSEVKNSIGKINLENGNVSILVEGYDFFAAPRVSPDGTRLAYYAWNFPYMPWDKTDLWVAQLTRENTIDSQKQLSTGHSSALHPIWSPNNKLYFASDSKGYWNIYDESLEPITRKNAEFAKPPWQFDTKTMSFVLVNGAWHLGAIYVEKASAKLALINLETKSCETIDLPFTNMCSLETIKDTLVCVAASPTEGSEIVQIYPETPGRFRVLSKGSEDLLSEDEISIPELIEYPTSEDREAYAFYYPPKNPKYNAPKNELPPLIVLTHGGPTANTFPVYSTKVQFWTSRGFAVADVNYGGSTGFGKEYKDRLLGTWGETDVNDCTNAALYLVKHGKADPNRLAIRGGSSGGYTTMAALIFKDVFQAGASYYGVSDIEMLAKETHKFEAKYMDLLVGPYPKEKEKYIKYSPINHIDQISCPIILLQGTEDKIVPPNQTEIVYEALLKKGIPTALRMYKGEQHGFRKAKNIVDSLNSEYYFYLKVFGIPIPKDLKPIEIVNLSEESKP